MHRTLRAHRSRRTPPHPTREHAAQRTAAQHAQQRGPPHSHMRPPTELPGTVQIWQRFANSHSPAPPRPLPNNATVKPHNHSPMLTRQVAQPPQTRSARGPVTRTPRAPARAMTALPRARNARARPQTCGPPWCTAATHVIPAPAAAASAHALEHCAEKRDVVCSRRHKPVTDGLHGRCVHGVTAPPPPPGRRRRSTNKQPHPPSDAPRLASSSERPARCRTPMAATPSSRALFHCRSAPRVRAPTHVGSPTLAAARAQHTRNRALPPHTCACVCIARAPACAAASAASASPAPACLHPIACRAAHARAPPRLPSPRDQRIARLQRLVHGAGGHVP